MLARREGRIAAAGAWDSAAAAWAQNRDYLANSLEREAGRREFTAEVQRCVAEATISTATAANRRGIGPFESVTEVESLMERMTLETVWSHIAEWAETNPEEAADAWTSGKVPWIGNELKLAAEEWGHVATSISFPEALDSWLHATKRKIFSLNKYVETIVSNPLPTSSPHWITPVSAWATTAKVWGYTAAAWAVGDAERARSLERSVSSAGRLGKAVAASNMAEAKAWLSAQEAHDEDLTEVALAWEHAAEAHAEGKTRVAEAWESAAVELEEASSPDPRADPK